MLSEELIICHPWPAIRVISARTFAAGNAVPQHSVLHKCFSFKDPYDAQLAPLMEALHLIAGKAPQIALVVTGSYLGTQ